MPYDPIEQEIIDALNAFAPYAAAQGIHDNTRWTLADKGLIGAIGWRKGYSFCASSMVNNQAFIIQILTDIEQKLGRTLYLPNTDRFAAHQWYGGWLYDLVWLKYDKNNNLINRPFLIDSPLVMESEWGNCDDVKDDFQKLLVARSKYRVMIFQCGNDIIEWGKRQIDNFKYTQSGDRYLFCSYQGNRLGFHFELYVAP